jgi:hypothetical protein
MEIGAQEGNGIDAIYMLLFFFSPAQAGKRCLVATLKQKLSMISRLGTSSTYL